MKKVLIVIAILIALVLTAAVVLPVIFKDDIKLAIDEQLEASVNADILFDVDNFSLSMFSNFPNITASMKEFGVINRAPFEGEILFAAEALEIEINLKSILFDDTPRLKGLSLIGPIINIKVLEDGRANYDIAVPSEEETPAVEEESGDFSFGIDHWEIVNGEIVYDDKSLPFLMELKGFDHSGSGDFTQDVFDLKTLTHADTINMGYDGDMYLANKSFDMDMTITLSEDMSKYTFKENTVAINDFAFGFDGWLFMGADYYDMDLTYAAKDNTFKSLLSVIPGMYTADFADIEAAGVLSFEGGAKGKYDSLSMPAFNVGLVVKDGMFKYPDLPTAVENINLDMKVDNADGVIDNTRIDITTFHMDFGKNPVDAKMTIANLRDYLTDATIKASLNLAELGQMFPIEGLDMKGIYTLDMTAKGTYDSTLKTMPVLQATMALDKGYIKSSEFPIPLEDLHFNTILENKTGKMSDFTARIKDFTMIMDKEEFRADVLFRNLDNYTWDVKAKGGVDIEKMTQIFPLEGMELAGKIKADIQTSGDMAALDAEQYEKLPTSGTMALDGFTYKDVALPYDVTIKTATATFDPRKMTLENYEGTVGRSDMKMKGNITNYMGYILHDNEVLKGTLDFQSNLLDMNELMAEEEEEGQAAPTEEDTAAYTVVPIPKNIDFVLNSTIKRMVFMDLNIDNAKGSIIIRDGVANLSDITFNLLGGAFKMAGAYDTKDPDKPLYDFNLDIENLPIKEAFSYFSIVKKFAPIAQNMAGNFSTDFDIKGELQQDYMPKLETITGSGLLKIAQASVGDSKIVSGLTNVTKLSDSKTVSVKDVILDATIKDGRLNIKPFDIKFGDNPGKVTGSTGMDGSLDYDLKMDVPAGKLGSQLTSVSSQLGMAQVDENTNIPMNVMIGGNFLEPKLQLVSSEQKQQLKEAAAEKAKEEAKEAASSVVKDIAKDTEAGNLIKNLTGTKTDSTKQDTTGTTKTVVKEQVEDQAKETLKNLLNRKKKN